jgi:hypothetical protein
MTPDPRTGLFSSKLVLQPSTSHQPTPDNVVECGSKAWLKETGKRMEKMEHEIRPATEAETAFRHGEWEEERRAVRAALLAANVPAARLAKFDACGAQCCVEYSHTAGKFRVRAFYCQDRFCLPCGRSRAKKIQAELVDLLQGETCRFVTLTRRDTGESLQTALNHLLKSFGKLRRQDFWLKSVRAGTAVVEITRGKNGDHWHVHLHALVVGGWLDRRELAAGWEKATSGSTVTHVRLVHDTARDVGYVTAYAGKGWSKDVLADHDALIECIISLRGRRLFFDFGDWYGRESQLCKVQHFDWKRVGWLGEIVADATAGNIWGRSVLASLGFAVGVNQGRPVFVGSPPSWSGP